jgi:tRNA modification GTPase
VAPARSAARLEAVLDFGEDAGLGAAEASAAAAGLSALASELAAHAAAFSRAELLRGGARVAIAGRPNAGKSSLLNALAGREAAIVSPQSGTTRDVLELPLLLAGHRVAVAGAARPALLLLPSPPLGLRPDKGAALGTRRGIVPASE